MSHIITPEVLEHAKRLREEGMTFDQIGARLGFSGSGISVAMRVATGLDGYGNPIGEKKRAGRLTDEKRELMLTLRGQNITLSEIAKASGFAYGTVEQVMREARAEGDWRAEIDPEKRAKMARATDWRLPAEKAADAPPPITDRVVLSLMARGMSRIAAQETAAAHRRGRA